ncbi:hypothetical protein GCM10008949_39370 [Deinococcus humi]|nr:hypothetical protein GCM10008949_39370 [Deinococcus humi]
MEEVHRFDTAKPPQEISAWWVARVQDQIKKPPPARAGVGASFWRRIGPQPHDGDGPQAPGWVMTWPLPGG